MNKMTDEQFIKELERRADAFFNLCLIAKLEEIKNEMIKTKGLTEAFDYAMIINKHIEELKGKSHE